jgi:hypothetical protein
MPLSSSALTSVASVYRGGGSVKCCLASRSRLSRASFAANGGNGMRVDFALLAFSSAACGVASSSRPSSYTAVKPANFITLPDARNVYLVEPRSGVAAISALV